MDRDVILQQAEKLARSTPLHGSESLCKLLLYLVRHSLEQPGIGIKEHQIATEVFGRPANFDPRLDAIVRVQTGRLRTKLQEYYSGTGAGDEIILEVPKGAYALTVRNRPATFEKTVAPPPAPAGSAVPPPSVPKQPLPHSPWWSNRAAVALGACSVVLLALTAYLLVDQSQSAAASAARAPSGKSLRLFWESFGSATEPPMLIYSNAAFVGRPETGMRYLDPERDREMQIMDYYTGVGEVVAAFELSRYFALLGRDLQVKRGRLLTLDDAKNRDLIFVGSPSENLSLQELPATREFVFRRGDVPERATDLAIANLRPRPGEKEVYQASPSTAPLKEDYALISLTPGLTPNRSVLVLAGTTTFGTQAAVEFVCRSNTLEEIITKLAPDGKTVPPFEAVLRVKISGGVPVRSEVVAMHKLGTN